MRACLGWSLQLWLNFSPFLAFLSSLLEAIAVFRGSNKDKSISTMLDREMQGQMLGERGDGELSFTMGLDGEFGEEDGRSSKKCLRPLLLALGAPRPENHPG